MCTCRCDWVCIRGCNFRSECNSSYRRDKGYFRGMCAGVRVCSGFGAS